MLHLRSSLLLLFVGLLGGLPLTTSAQSVDAVVENMRNKHTQQLESVDTYVVETNLYTSYNKKVMRDGEPTYETQTKMKGDGAPSFASTSTPTTAYGLQFDRLKEQASYEGTETINGTECHILQVDDPSAVNADVGDDAERMTYFIDASEFVPVRLVLQTKGQGGRGSKPSTVTVNMMNYETVDGLTLPHRMEIQFEMEMSDQQRQQMKQAMQKMKDLPEQQRQQMENMMGSQMEMMKQMMSGDPVVIEVQSVEVNSDLPDGMF